MHPAILGLLVFVGIPLTLCALVALFAALMLLLPEPIRQARINLEDRPWRSILLGALNFAGAGIIVTLLINLANNNWQWQSAVMPFILFVTIVIAIPAVIGLCAMVILIGTRLGETRSPLWTYLRGGGLLLLACLFPFVGWFVFTPLVVWASIGSVVGTLVKSKTPEAPKVMEPLHD